MQIRNAVLLVITAAVLALAGFLFARTLPAPIVIEKPSDSISENADESISFSPTSEIRPMRETDTSGVNDSDSSPSSADSYGKQKVYTQAELLELADNKYASGEVPLGDNKYTTSGAKKGYIYICNTPPAGGGAFKDGPWIHGTTWNYLNKANVDGTKTWANATFSDIISGVTRMLSGNGLPTNHTTGTFPVSSSDDAYQYDRNPNSIKENNVSLSVPSVPAFSDSPFCMPSGEVGVMLTGVRLFNGMDAAYRDAPAHEVQDSCGGHPQESGQYHYHGLSACFKDIGVASVLGYANDGFPITGPKVAENEYLTTEDLDVCHGIVSEITDEKGKSYATYHYVMTYDFPYSASCYRAQPTVKAPSAQSGGGQSGTQQGGGGGGGTPPQEAVSACSGKTSSATCSFSTPNGTISGICRTPPGSSSLACVPN